MSTIRAKAMFRMQYPSLGVGIGLMLFLTWNEWGTPTALAVAYLIGCCFVATSMFDTEMQLGEHRVSGESRILPLRTRPTRLGFILTADQIPKG